MDVDNIVYISYHERIGLNRFQATLIIKRMVSVSSTLHPVCLSLHNVTVGSGLGEVRNAVQH